MDLTPSQARRLAAVLLDDEDEGSPAGAGGGGATIHGPRDPAGQDSLHSTKPGPEPGLGPGRTQGNAMRP